MERDLRFPQVKYLYGSFVEKGSAFEQLTAHIHADYWQLEIAVSGDLLLRLDDRELTIPPGNAVLVPPGVRHHFVYNDPGISFATAKFKTDALFPDLPAEVISSGAVESYFLAEIVHLLQQLPPEFERIIGFLLGNLFAMHYGSRRDPGMPKIITIINSLISRHGGRIRIQELAERSGYSRDYLNRVIKNRFGIPLKNYIDNELAERARRYLDYSERNISEVASQLGFPDIYSFSRFFSRMNNGLSPTAFRHRHQQPPLFKNLSKDQ
ncbi:MAG: helix-turn-helix domain-containing protein [Lentisphaeria bacterium]|nr:helix-turn-helix domain-containing protein [Lentisphaeria bacterium]